MLSTRDAGAYPFVFQRFSEPVGVIATIPEQPVDIRQAAEQCPRADVVADLSGSDEQVERTALTIADGMQLGVQAAFGSADQASTPPFFTPMLVAVRWALR